MLPRLSAEAYRPQTGEVCISIGNPRQAPAVLHGWTDVLRLGFHDVEVPFGNFQLMSLAQARAVLGFSRTHRGRPFVVHCEFGQSRSVAIGAFLAAWWRRPLAIEAFGPLPNAWVVRQLRRAAFLEVVHHADLALLQTAVSALPEIPLDSKGCQLR